MTTIDTFKNVTVNKLWTTHQGYNMISNVTAPTNGTPVDTYKQPVEVLIVAGSVIIPTIIITLIGNCLTILSFIRDKRLHESINIYILNLAIADFLIGSMSMPVYLTYTLQNNVWILGYNFCKIFLFMDLVFTSVTLEIMILISYDRLMLLKHWSRNYKEQTRKKAYIRSGIAWIIGIVYHGPGTLFWDVWTGVNSVEPDDCEVQYTSNYLYTAAIAILAFPVPFILLSIFNCLIFYEIRKLLSKREQLSNLPSVSSSQESTFSNGTRQDKVTHFSQTGSWRTRQIFHRRSGKKAAKALAVLTVVFVLTWAPYSVVLVLQSFCGDCVSIPVYETFTWFLWFKSAINPFIYALNCNRFRRNFKYFLCCEKKNRNSALSLNGTEVT